MQKMDNVDICTRKRANIKRKFYKLTNFTISASLLKFVPVGCKDAVLPEPFSKNHNVNCLTFERNTRQPYNDKLCLFRTLALHLHGNEKLEEEISKIFNLFLNDSEEEDFSKFQGVHLSDFLKPEDLLQLNTLPLWHWFFRWRTDWWALSKKFSKVWKKCQGFTLQQSHLLRQQHQRIVQNLPVYYVWRIFPKIGNLEWHLNTCSDRVKHIYPKNFYELRERLFEKLYAFNIPYRTEQKLFQNLAKFDFESFCVKEANSYKQTETTTWIGKLEPISVSTSSNFIPENIFLCNANPHQLISSFITALAKLANQSKSQMKLNFIRVETAIKIKLCDILEQLNQRRNRAERL